MIDKKEKKTNLKELSLSIMVVKDYIKILKKHRRFLNLLEKSELIPIVDNLCHGLGSKLMTDLQFYNSSIKTNETILGIMKSDLRTFKKCKFSDGRYCENPENDWDGLCSPEACELPEKDQDKIWDKTLLQSWREYNRGNINGN